MIFVDGKYNFHPYECGGTEEGCPHCLFLRTPEHNPDKCALCHWDDEEAVDEEEQA